jgi:hypothetical protein
MWVTVLARESENPFWVIWCCADLTNDNTEVRFVPGVRSFQIGSSEQKQSVLKGAHRDLTETCIWNRPKGKIIKRTVIFITIKWSRLIKIN